MEQTVLVEMRDRLQNAERQLDASWIGESFAHYAIESRAVYPWRQQEPFGELVLPSGATEGRHSPGEGGLHDPRVFRKLSQQTELLRRVDLIAELGPDELCRILCIGFDVID